jgi:heme-degrading monooxygenase HmoA
MIARIWHGTTPASKAGEYFDVLMRTGVTEYRATPGNRSVTVLRSIEGEIAHFLIITLWDSREDIRLFAGDDIETAHYYPEDQEYLLELEPQVKHYEVLVDR